MATTAWDDTRPPELDLIRDCVHCGFCLPTCPSYAVFEEEMDSPRGRIVLMRIGHEEGSEVSREMTVHLDRCLGCMACVTACPSGVQYDRLIEDTRAQVERRHSRTPKDRALRAAIFALFPYPRRLRLLRGPLRAYRGLRLRGAVARLFPTLATMEGLAPPLRTVPRPRGGCRPATPGAPWSAC